MIRRLFVHCRTGSLEINVYGKTKLAGVHCRTGSLEISGCDLELLERSVLPYRQLRKGYISLHSDTPSALPYRQLRKG